MQIILFTYGFYNLLLLLCRQSTDDTIQYLEGIIRLYNDNYKSENFAGQIMKIIIATHTLSYPYIRTR